MPSGGLPSLPMTIQNPLLFDKANSIAFVDSMNNKNTGKSSKTTIMECLGVVYLIMTILPSWERASNPN
jgi:hypothetical protein